MNRFEEAYLVAERMAQQGDTRANVDLLRIRNLIDTVEVYWSGNCDEPCGWDGESNRCHCGNRRIYWEWQDGMGYFTPMEY